MLYCLKYLCLCYWRSNAIQICNEIKNTADDFCTVNFNTDTNPYGQSCIVASTTSANQSGFDSFCNWVLDTDNKLSCAKGTLATTDIFCYGCINQTEPCSSYYGTKDQCQLFTGNGKKCFGDSATTKIACRDKKCTDVATALNDSNCENLPSGCLFNEVGCVRKAADCVSQMGKQGI